MNKTKYIMNRIKIDQIKQQLNVKQLHYVAALPHNAAPLWTCALKALKDMPRRWENKTNK